MLVVIAIVAVFIDTGDVEDSSGFRVEYLDRRWFRSNVAPIHHNEGTTLSMADGHAEYWKWKGRETIEIPRKTIDGIVTNRPAEILDVG